MSVLVRVPASSANLGPGFDSFAAALGLHLELEVTASGDGFGFDTDLDVARDRGNLAVAAFERVLPAADLRFTMRSSIPLSGGLGSSAAARVAGLLAACALAGADVDVLAVASELEGHPDNAAAALHGGIVVAAGGEVARIAPPAGLAGVLVVPFEPVVTAAARAALPPAVPHADAAANAAAAALLVLGLERGDLELVGRGLRDRLHEPYRARLYPRSAAVAAAARQLGALGATISGAGPTVLVWVAADASAAVAGALEARAAGWADVVPVAFEGRGAEVVG